MWLSGRRLWPDSQVADIRQERRPRRASTRDRSHRNQRQAGIGAGVRTGVHLDMLAAVVGDQAAIRRHATCRDSHRYGDNRRRCEDGPHRAIISALLKASGAPALDAQSAITAGTGVPAASRWTQSGCALRTPRCALQPHHLGQPLDHPGRRPGSRRSEPSLRYINSGLTVDWRWLPRRWTIPVDSGSRPPHGKGRGESRPAGPADWAKLALPLPKLFGLEYGALGTGSLIWRAGRERLIAWNAGSLPFYVGHVPGLVVAALLLPRLTATPWGLPRRADARPSSCLALTAALLAQHARAQIPRQENRVHLHAPISQQVSGRSGGPNPQAWLFPGNSAFETARTMLRGGRLAMVVPVVVARSPLCCPGICLSTRIRTCSTTSASGRRWRSRVAAIEHRAGIGIHFLSNAFNLVS